MRNSWIIIPIFLLLQSNVSSQSQFIYAGLTSKLDSRRLGNGIESHFAGLYFKATVSVDVYIQSLPVEAQHLMMKMENKFADYFFQAVEANQNGSKIPIEWENYFSDKNFSSVQFKLMGANAHINGDIWQVFTSSF